MMNKPAAPDAAFLALPEQRIIALTGRDAVAFAQAQTMNDVTALDDGGWQWSGWLTPKGRVIALFAVLRIDAETLWLLVDEADAALLVEQLRRFVFRSKVAIAVDDSLYVAGAWRAPGGASASAFVAAGDGSLELDLGAHDGARTLRIGPDAPGPGQTDNAMRWRAFDLAHGWPRLSPDQRERWTPQQLSLQRLNAYSVRKGCYPGQEIVARTHFLGQAKRGLARLHVDAAVEPGDEVVADGRAVGSIACVAGVAGAAATETLAVLPAGYDQPCTVNDHVARGVALLDGLAR